MPTEPATESHLELPRSGARWWIIAVLLGLVGLTAFILISAGEARIPFMYTTTGS